MAYKAYKFRLYPNTTQTRSLEQSLETLRHVYNAGLAYWRDLYAAEKRSPTRNEINNRICTIRNLQIADRKAGGAGPHWLANVSSVAIRDTLARLGKAFARFFAIRKGKIAVPAQRKVRKDGKPAGYPRFKGQGQVESIPSDNYNGCSLRDRTGKTVLGDCPLGRTGYRFELFGVGLVKCLVHRPVEGIIKGATVVRESDGKWYVALTAQQSDRLIPVKDGPAVGIDVGLEHFLTTSDGEHEPNPRILKGNLKKLRRLQRASCRKTEVARKAKRKFRECRNLQKSFRRVARLHARVRNLRREHRHQVANRLVGRYATICAEDLNVRGMLRNGKLSRAIGDAGWAGFLVVLKLKAESAGARFVKVNASGTSQTCPECGGEVRKTLKERTHNCPHCGYKTQRDHAAARVILQRGMNLDGAGSVPAGRNSGVTPGVPRSPVCPRTTRCRKSVSGNGWSGGRQD